jgi:hypothetical protein
MAFVRSGDAVTLSKSATDALMGLRAAQHAYFSFAAFLGAPVRLGGARCR